MAGSSGRSGRLFRGGVGVLACLALGELVGRSGLVERRFLPPASDVLAWVGDLVTEPTFGADLSSTLRGWLLGLLLAIAIAVPLGAVLGSLPGLNAAARVVVEFLRPIPSVAIIPVAILVFGLGVEMRIGVVAYAATWPILFNTIYGPMEVDPVAR